MSSDVFKLSGTKVYVHDGNIEKAIKKFKKKVNDNGILQTLREKEFYEKPTTKRKREAGAAKARYRKKLQKEANPVSANRKRKY